MEQKNNLEKLLRETFQEGGDSLSEQEMLVQNNLLKIELKKKEQTREISLCYLPGILHTVILLLLAMAICLLVHIPFVQILAILIAVLGSAAGIVITRIGVRYFDLRKRLTIRISVKG